MSLVLISVLNIVSNLPVIYMYFTLNVINFLTFQLLHVLHVQALEAKQVN